jgi:hypothetical protein
MIGTSSRAAIAVSAVLTTLASGAAFASAPADAEKLYVRGMALLRDDHGDAACAALQQSETLEARGGTLLSLAYCHERQNKLGLAYAEYEESLRRLRLGGGRPDREAFAADRMKAVEGRVVFVTLDVRAASSAANLEVVVAPTNPSDPPRTIVFGAHREKPLALDPDGGAYRIEVRAPDRTPFVGEVHVTGHAVVPAVLAVPDLVTAHADPAPAPPPASVTADDPNAGRGRRTLGFVIGGTGVLFAAAGAVFGVVALNCAAEARKEGGTCSRTQAEDGYANVANAGIGLGALGLVIGSYLYFTAPKPAKSSLAFRPSLGPSSAGLSVDGRF